MTSWTSPNPACKSKLVFVQACHDQDSDAGQISLRQEDKDDTPVRIAPVLKRYQTMDNRPGWMLAPTYWLITLLLGSSSNLDRHQFADEEGEEMESGENEKLKCDGLHHPRGRIIKKNKRPTMERVHGASRTNWCRR